MERFTQLTGRIAAMPAANIDTDVIMPKAFLKGIDRAGLALGLFHDLRFDAEGRQRPEFLLHRADMADTRFLLVGPNFGCGSSREHAVWGMLQYGIRAIIGTGFAGIFADNAANNGLLLIILDPIEIASLGACLSNDTGLISIDLEKRIIIAGDVSIDFGIDPDVRRALMLGLDRIGDTLTHSARIHSFQQAYLAEHPWLVEESAR
ncbi:MAG: 3-isopropylmalate dehydratase small subunit [Pseudomonadota bacterium]